MTNFIAKRVEALPPLRDVIATNKLSARKRLGQNFLLDLNLTRRIARSAGVTDAGTTIEVGPGPGGLTRALILEGAKNIIAIEQDSRAIAALSQLKNTAGDYLTLIQGNALNVNMGDLGSKPRYLIANLPYNIATRLIINCLRKPQDFDKITVMVQKEVAMRMCAPAGRFDYSRLSIIVQLLTQPAILFDVPASAFTPRPKVTSTLIQLTPYKKSLFSVNRNVLEILTSTAFNQRRKMLRSSLKKFGGDSLLLAAEIEPQRRPQSLTIEEFCRLARALETKIPSLPISQISDETG